MVAMGLFERFKSRPALADTALAMTTPASPWTDRTHLSRIVVADLSGVTATAVSREDAMRVPAVVRARAVICGTLSRQPLVAFTGDARASVQPAWLDNTTTAQAPRTRMLWTLDDLLFYGTSLWVRSNDDQGVLVDAIRASRDQWRINADNVVDVRDGDAFRVASASEVILFEAPQEGLLTLAVEAIKASRDMRSAWSKRVEAPIPLVELHNTDPNMPLESDEINELVKSWEAARRAGGTAYTPHQIQTNSSHGTTPTDLFIQGRNAERLDYGNWTNLPASVLDGSLSTASLTYTTQEGNRTELVDISLAYWANPIEARLSLDDVSAPGDRIGFDLQYMTLPAAANHPSGPTFED